MSDSRPIRVGIVGTGIFAQRHLRAYRAVGQHRFEIVACCNRTRSKAEAFAKDAGIPDSAVYTNWEDLIKDENVELVDALLPVQFNLEVVKAAVAANKHILFEKPIAHSVEDARQIVQVAQQAKSIVAVAENWSYHPLARAVARYVHAGHIGEVVNFMYNSTRPYNPNSPYHQTAWRQNPEHVGGYLSDGGVHDMAHLVPILGKFASVTGFATKRHKIHAVQDTLAFAVQLENNVVGTMNMTFCSAGVKAQRLEVFGTQGTVRLMNDDTVQVLDAQGNEVSADVVKALLEDTEGLSDVEGELFNLYNVIRHNATLGVTVEEAFHHFAVIASAVKSTVSNVIVQIPSAN